MPSRQQRRITGFPAKRIGRVGALAITLGVGGQDSRHGAGIDETPATKFVRVSTHWRTPTCGFIVSGTRTGLHQLLRVTTGTSTESEWKRPGERVRPTLRSSTMSGFLGVALASTPGVAYAEPSTSSPASDSSSTTASTSWAAAPNGSADDNDSSGSDSQSPSESAAESNDADDAGDPPQISVSGATADRRGTSGSTSTQAPDLLDESADSDDVDSDDVDSDDVDSAVAAAVGLPSEVEAAPGLPT